MNNWYLHNGFVFRNRQLSYESILVLDGRIVAFGSEAQKMRQRSTVSIMDFDAAGCVICHGFIDLHTHLREPGYSSKETIATGTKAAAAGGFTMVSAMPNTNPPLDSVERLEIMQQLVYRNAQVKVNLVAAVTHNRAGEKLVDISQLANRGIKLFSDDGDPVAAEVMPQAMEQIAAAKAVLVNHLEEKSLVCPGFFADAIPASSEYLMLKRDLQIAARARCHYHAAHLSCKESVEMICTAKQQGLQVTSEVTPHHLTLTIDDITYPEGNYQMKPPLRTEEDRQALIEGLRLGIIDAIATDHAPHGSEKENGLYSGSPFGVTGLETAFPALYTRLVLTGAITLEQLLTVLTQGPGKVLNVDADLLIGVPADLVVLDLNCRRRVEADSFYSKGKNSPFLGQVLQGWPVLTLVDGEEKYSAKESKY